MGKSPESATTGARLMRALSSLPLIGIVRRTDDGLRPSRELIDGGLAAVEVTLTTPGALATIAELRREQRGDAVVGAGSVRTVSEARAAISAGAEFLVTPVVCEDVLAEAARESVPVVCGAFTPTEVNLATLSGASLVKLFPASLGGTAYVRELLAPMPELLLVPTGGVTVQNVAEWFRAGATAVAVGSALVPATPLEPGEVTRRARSFREAVIRVQTAEEVGGHDATS